MSRPHREPRKYTPKKRSQSPNPLASCASQVVGSPLLPPAPPRPPAPLVMLPLVVLPPPIPVSLARVVVTAEFRVPPELLVLDDDAPPLAALVALELSEGEPFCPEEVSLPFLDSPPQPLSGRQSTSRARPNCHHTATILSLQGVPVVPPARSLAPLVHAIICPDNVAAIVPDLAPLGVLEQSSTVAEYRSAHLAA